MNVANVQKPTHSFYSKVYFFFYPKVYDVKEVDILMIIGYLPPPANRKVYSQ